MHFAYPPRKSSNPAPYNPRSSRIPTLRRSRLKVVALVGLTIIFLIWLFSGGSKGARREPLRVLSGKPAVVLVTVLDDKSGPPEYIQQITDNRKQYAEIHGYGTHLAQVDDYDLKGSPKSWAKVVAVRHAMTKFPDCKYFWFLDQNALIMNPTLKLESSIMGSAQLEAKMIKDRPVVPPDSIIKTFSHLKAEDVNFVLTQDKDGLSSGSFILRNGEWAKFFLETWFDPLYRSYNFQKAEAHALEHIVQWHPTILSKLAIVPQRLINSYNRPQHGEEFKDDDLVIRFPGCIVAKGDTNCAEEANKFTSKWKEAFGSS